MEKNTPRIITINGWSGSGKTTFCEKLIAELLSRGHRVAAAKNSHRSIDTDKPGSDSKRFYNAGAGAVCLNAENSMTIFFRENLDKDNGLAELFPDYDFIVAEGFKIENAFRIESVGAIKSSEHMKNPAGKADLIIYADDIFASTLEKEFARQSPEQKKAVLIHRDSVPEAADLICAELDTV